MNFLLLTHSKLLADMYVAVGKVDRVRICSNEPDYQDEWRFCPGHLLLPLSSIRKHSGSLCMLEGTVNRHPCW